jgi:hypothetical protein
LAELDLTLHLGAQTADEVRRSEQNLRWLAFAPDANTLRVLRGLCAARGEPGLAWMNPRSWSEVDRGSVPNELKSAVGCGALRIERVERRPMVAALDEEPDWLGPAPETPPEPDAWIALRLVDQDGKPVGGRAYRVIAPDGVPYDGTLSEDGKAKITGLKAGSCKVSCPYREARGATTHSVTETEHASGIAFAYGFDDHAAVWDHPENASLRADRSDPHVLTAGDQLFVPETKDEPVYKPTSDTHTFRVNASPLKLRLKLFDLGMKPISEKPCKLDGVAVTTGDDRLIERPIEKNKTTTSLVLDENGVQRTLDVGRLDPMVDASPSAWRSRLFNPSIAPS